MGFRVSIPSSPDPTPYNIGTAPATVDFWSNPYPNIEDPFPEGTTFLWDFGDGATSMDGPNAVYHTYTTPGVYDVTLTVTFPDGCPVVVTETKEDYLLVTSPDQVSTRSSFSPFTESICQNILTEQRPMDDIDPETLPVLPLKNTYIHADFKYASQFDCVYLAYYTRGEPSFSRDCTAVEYFNRGQEAIKSYGGMPQLTAWDPTGAICVGAVKNSQSENTLSVTITLTDSHGNVGDIIVSPDPVIIQCYQIPDDFSECRLRDVYMPCLAWVT
jgi:PKD repeat protein